MNRTIGLISIFIFFVSPVYAQRCIDLFDKRSSPHFPGSVYVSVPADVVPGLLKGVSIETLKSVLDKLSVEVGVEIPLPEGTGPKTHKVELDIDVDQVEMTERGLVSRLNTTLKSKDHFVTPAKTAPKEVVNPNVKANALMALHIDMVNAAISNSLKDMQTRPWNFGFGGLNFKVSKAPQLVGITGVERHYSRLMIEAEASVPRSSVQLAGVVFNNDITAKVKLEAEFVVQNNSVSLKIVGLHKNSFELDTSSVRFGVSRSAVSSLANYVAGRMSASMTAQPIVFKDLFTLPNNIMGYGIQLVHMFIDNDGYLKIQLNIEPHAALPTNLKIRLNNR